MKPQIPILVMIGIGIVAGITLSLFMPEDGKKNVEQDPYIIEDVGVYSGPLTIKQKEYLLGEPIFFIIKGIAENENGVIRVFTPLGKEYYTIFYDGSKKSDFNQYFTPDTSKILGFCTPEEFFGKWKVVWDNDVYPPAEFEINEWLKGAESTIKKEC